MLRRAHCIHTCLESICCYWADKRRRQACGAYSQWRGTLWGFCVPHTRISIGRWPSFACTSRVSTVFAVAQPGHSIPCRIAANAHTSRRPHPVPLAWLRWGQHLRDHVWSIVVYIAAQPACCPSPPVVHRASDRNPVSSESYIWETIFFLYYTGMHTFDFVPGRFLRNMVEPSAIFMFHLATAGWNKTTHAHTPTPIVAYAFGASCVDNETEKKFRRPATERLQIASAVLVTSQMQLLGLTVSGYELLSFTHFTLN